MNLPKLSALLIACGLVAGTPLARADWAQSADPLVVAAKPGSYQTQVQNPPTFSWARHPTGSGSYTLEIRQGATVVRSYTTDRTWYLPSTLLPNGNYTWRVRPASATDWSSERQFSISAVSKPFVVPENAALRTAVLARPRPRGLPTSVPAVSAWSAAMKAERGNALQGLSNEVLLQTGKLALSKDTNWGLTASQPATAAFVQQQTSVRTQINLSGRQLEASALLYRLTGDVRFLAEALRRGDELAALDPFGPTSYINQDQATRVIALSLSKALDYLGAALDAQRRTLWRDVIAARTGEIYKDLADANMRFDQLPYDSLRSTNLGYLTIIAALTLGDIPAATTWFDFSVRGYAASLMVWSGQEGGYSNGTAYAEYAADYALQIWPPLLQATGINLFNKPWSQGFLTFLMQFVPPGSKNHLFGDGQETAPEFRFMKAFASRFATPEAAWYARNLSGNEDNLTMLQAAYPLPQSSVTTAAPPANSAFFPGIGWAAMHSKMADLTRTSVYFKSSPFGSFSHGHGDQNAFVISKAGIPLLTATGWYDWYDSPLARSWYRQTKAANAITFDGGTGQLIDGYRETLQRNGALTAFSTSAAIDYSEGNATAAYGGALSSAVRQLWFLRNVDAVVVRDALASAKARTYEWNFHALAPLTVSGTTVSVSYLGRSACVRPLVATGLRFEKRSGPPPRAGVTEDHGVFLTTTAQPAAEFLMLIDIGCKNPAVSLTTSASGRTLTVGGQSVALPR